MPVIQQSLFIAAPVERVFDLARNIDLHKKSMQHHQEDAVAGTTNGLIELHDTVTFKAKHLGKIRYHKSRITEMQKPVQFMDEMVEGEFKRFHHLHHFRVVENGTIMTDKLDYEAPYGLLGRWLSRFYLHKYLSNLLEIRNLYIKQVAESERWKQFL